MLRIASSSRRECEIRPPTLSKWFCIMGFNDKRVLFDESLPFLYNWWSSSLKYAVWTRYIRRSLVFSITLALISSEVGVCWHSRDCRTVKKVTPEFEDVARTIFEQILLINLKQYEAILNNLSNEEYFLFLEYFIYFFLFI